MATTYSLTRSSSTVTEGNQITFTITRSGDKPAETLYFSTLSDGTATYGEGDYATTSGGAPSNIPVNFSSGTISRTVTLNILNDGTADSGEQFRAIVQRNASDPTSIYLDRSSYVTINDAAPSTSYSLTASPSTVTEGNQVTFTISRSGDKPAETIYFSTLSDGTATYGEGDYATTSGGAPSNIAVSFSSGTTSRTVTLNVLDDGLADSGEQFRAIVQRNASDPTTTYLDRSSYVTINDAAPSTSYSLTASPSTVTEGGQVTFTITRSGDKPAETIYFSTLSDGTATFGEGDYSAASGVAPSNIAVSFSSGTTSRTVTLNVLNDGSADSGEQFRAIVQRNASDPTTTYLDRSSFVTINDAASTGTAYTLTPSPTTVVEGNQATFTITRSGDKPAETVYFSTLSDGTATHGEGDYTTTSGGAPANVAVTFASGDSSKSVTLNIVNDGVADSGEQFRAIVQRSASDPTTTFLSRSGFVTINDAAATGTTYTLTPSPTTVAEGNQVTFTITRSGDKPAETVYFSTLADGTATFAEGDYSTTAGSEPKNISLTFTAGESAETVTLNIRNDGLADWGEQFRAIVQRHSSDPVATFLDRSGFVTINESAPQGSAYTLSPSTTAVNEGGQVTFTITRSGQLNGERVYFSAWKDTASFEEGDYRLSNGETPLNVAVDFGSGDNVRTVTLSIQNDNVADAGERFRAIVQGNPPSSSPTSNVAQTGYITIGEGVQTVPYSLTPSATSVMEGGQITFTIRRTGGASAETVYFSTLSDGTATYGERDYTTLGGGRPENIPIMFGAGELTKTITLSVRDDGPGDSGELFRTIIQADDGDAASAYLARSAYVTIGEPTPRDVPKDESWLEGFTNYLPSFVNVAQAAETTTIRLSGLRYPVGDGSVTEAKDGGDGWYIEQDLGSRYVPNVPLRHPHKYYHLGEDWNLQDDEGNSSAYAIYKGVVVYKQAHGDFGNTVVMQHTLPDGKVVYSLYAHLAAFAAGLPMNLEIPAGTNLGVIGGSGGVLVHLHFEIFSLGAGKDIFDYLVSGVEGHFGYVHNASGTFAESPGPITPYLSYVSGGITWYNPSIYIDNHRDFAIVTNEDNAANVDISSKSGNTSIGFVGEAKEILLSWYEDIRFLGNALADKVRVGLLNDTTILKNTIYFDGGAGNDELVATETEHRLVVEGGLGDDRLVGGSADDTFDGGEGNDVLDGGPGADSMAGGSGDDAYAVDASSDVIIELSGQGMDIVQSLVSHTLAANVEHLTLVGGAAIGGTGNALANFLTGNAAANSLSGLDGNDRLDGGAGADVMAGGGGFDVYVVDHVGDKVSESDPAGGRDLVLSSVSFMLGNHVENLTLTGLGAISGTGNALANTITGNGGANLLNGGGGADRMDGGLGYDTYVVDHAGDKVVESDPAGGRDTVRSSVSFALPGNVENLVLTGFAKLDGTGNALANALTGNAAANRLNGGGAADTMAGLGGNDLYVVDNAGDKVIETDPAGGVDTVQSSLSWTLNAHVENLVLTGFGNLDGTGNGLDNRLTGNGGANKLGGGLGDDRLYGGLGSDVLKGGAGADGFWFDTAPGASNIDNLADFSPVDDTIHLSRAAFAGLALGGPIGPGAFRAGTAAGDASDRILYDGATGRIFYDADGNGATAALLFATVAPGTAITNLDFIAY